MGELCVDSRLSRLLDKGWEGKDWWNYVLTADFVVWIL